MKVFPFAVLTALLQGSGAAFTSSKTKSTGRLSSTSLFANEALTAGSGAKVLLVGPSFLQLNIAKAAKKAGLRPIIIAPQKKIDSFAQYINDDEIISDASIGLPDEKGEVEGVVFCSEEAVYSTTLIDTVVGWDGYKGGSCKRAIACVPLSNPIKKEKSMGWMPIFNNDSKEEKIWKDFVNSWKSHPIASNGNIVRFGSLWGGSVDGPEMLSEIGLDERIYKMSLENYRDLRERAFDRFRLGAQVLLGDDVNVKPESQENVEKENLSGEEIEAFKIQGGYPEQDRTNRHTIAAAVVESLLRSAKGTFSVDSSGVPSEFTVLSKSVKMLPTTEEWDQLFTNPGPAEWPSPVGFVMPEVPEEFQE
mmetsp:Transcript_21769/g.32537  ORF Transcript_21769/g.32537 Transcript_21769/m.32537 type:complete len:363 (-) Transcript_21769:38-1126(-)